MLEFDGQPGAVRDLVKTLEVRATPLVKDLGDGHQALLTPGPGGWSAKLVKDLLQPHAAKPDRRQGTATLLDLDSFIAWVNRNKDPDTVIFADVELGKTPSLLAVIDYNKAGGDGMETARFGKHRGLYTFPLSRAWLAWEAIEKKGFMSVPDFTAVLEERIVEVLAVVQEGENNSEAEKKLLRRIAQLGGGQAGPAKLMELSRGIEIHERSVVKEAASLQSGTRTIIYQSEHTNAAGEKLDVPSCFAVACPVFERDAPYPLPIRLRYRKTGATVVWGIQRYEADVFFEDAIELAVKRVAEETTLPVLRGRPEGG